MALSRKADGPVEVQVPGQAQDRPSWKRVGIIAAAGFVIGVGWPRLAGVRLGPSPPEAASASAGASAGASASAAPAPSTSVSSIAALPVVPPAQAAAPSMLASTGSPPAATLAPGGVAPPVATVAPSTASAPPGAGFSVGSGSVFACKTSDGDSLKGTDCGKLTGLDAIVVPRLRKLAECPDASSASGRLQLVLRLDFARGWISPELGRNQSVASPDALLACAKPALAGASLASLAHDNPRYSVAYTVTFGANAGASPSGTADLPRTAAESTDATVQVVWEVAIVRDAPKTGKVVARLQRGTPVRIGPVKDGWYPVKYGETFASDGWVYRGAIGR